MVNRDNATIATDRLAMPCITDPLPRAIRNESGIRHRNGFPDLPQCTPVTASIPRAAAIDRGTATIPRRLAVAMEG